MNRVIETLIKALVVVVFIGFASIIFIGQVISIGLKTMDEKFLNRTHTDM